MIQQLILTSWSFRVCISEEQNSTASAAAIKEEATSFLEHDLALLIFGKTIGLLYHLDDQKHIEMSTILTILPELKFQIYDLSEH